VGRELAGVPLLVNVVEGGKTPQLEVKEYAGLGFSIVLYANFLMRSMMAAGRSALAHLAVHGETASQADTIATWTERQSLFNLPAFTAAEEHYDRPWSTR
jgi:2-methylisocitrate lyase-like PEP mutase family enzyme